MTNSNKEVLQGYLLCVLLVSIYLKVLENRGRADAKRGFEVQLSLGRGRKEGRSHSREGGTSVTHSCLLPAFSTQR